MQCQWYSQNKPNGKSVCMALLNIHVDSASEFMYKVENTNIIFAAEEINRIW